MLEETRFLLWFSGSKAMNSLRIGVCGSLLAMTAVIIRVAAQDQPLSAVVGRSSAMAPFEAAPTTEKPSLDSIDRISDVEDLDSSGLDGTEELKPKDLLFVSVFEGPCHFSERTNDVARTLVIYEGMQVVVSRDGRYQVSMIAEAPLAPVVIRMQLRVTEIVDNVRVDHGTITLAPIVIETNVESSDQQPSNTVRIRRTGYSHLLRRLMIEGKPSARTLSFSRAGAARFGSIPEAAKYSGRFQATESDKTK